MSKKNGLVVLALALSGLFLTGAPIEGGVLTGSWIAPTTNTDGSTLTTLAHYRVYYDYYTSHSPCPGSAFLVVPSSTPAPQPNHTVSTQITGLNTGAVYSVSVTAVDTSGHESVCSAFASAVARDGVQPPRLDIYTDRSVYSPGQTMNVRLSLVNPLNVSVNVDVYVAVQLPGGQLLFFPGFGMTPAPFMTSLLLGPLFAVSDFPILTYTFGSEPVGAYTWYAVLTPPGADPMNPANWLSLDDAHFTKQ
jgi:hypothetical protein